MTTRRFADEHHDHHHHQNQLSIGGITFYQFDKKFFIFVISLSLFAQIICICLKGDHRLWHFLLQNIQLQTEMSEKILHRRQSLVKSVSFHIQPRYHRQQRECVLKSNLLRATKAPAAARHSHNSHCFLSHWQLSQASLSRSTAVVTVHSLWPADCHWCSGADCRRPAAPSSAGPTIHASPALPVPTIL